MASVSRDVRTGFFYAQFYNPAKRPSRKTIPLRTKTKRIAERALARLEDAFAVGELDPWEVAKEPDEQLYALGVAVAAYLSSCSHLNVNTVKTYRDILIPFQKHLTSDFQLSQISVRRILAWLDSTSANDVTRRKYVNHLGCFFRFFG